MITYVNVTPYEALTARCAPNEGSDESLPMSRTEDQLMSKTSCEALVSALNVMSSWDPRWGNKVFFTCLATRTGSIETQRTIVALYL